MDFGVIVVAIFGLVQLAIWGGAAYFLIRKVWWRNAIAAAGNPPEATVVSTRSVNGERIFTVTPARSSRAGIVMIIVGVSILLLFTLSLPDAFLASLGLIPLIMGTIAFAIGSRYRMPAEIVVAGQSLRAGPRTWPLAEIAAIKVKQGSNVNINNPKPGVYRDVDGRIMQRSQSTTVMFSKAFNRQAVERSYIVTLRSHNGSNETVLCGGLTAECANSLCSELLSNIAVRTHNTDEGRVST